VRRSGANMTLTLSLAKYSVGLSDIFSPFNERGCRQTSSDFVRRAAGWIYRQLKINGPDLPNALADHKLYAKRLKMGWNGVLGNVRHDEGHT
jgi:hypothetical protein